MDAQRKIVVGVDGSEGASGALDAALRQAALWDASLEAVLAWDYLDQPGDASFDPHYTQERAEGHVRDLVEAAGDGEVEVAARAVCGRAAPVLLDAGRDADLVVVGGRGKGGFLGLRLGSVSQSVVSHSHRPVMVARGDGSVDGGPVVVGVDGSEHARRALAWARDEARARGVPLRVVHGWTPPGDAAAVPTTMPAFAAAAAALVEEALAWVGETAPDVAVEGRSPADGAARALLGAAEDAALVVVGGRGRGGFTGLLLGSVSQQVTHHASCPVVVVPAPDRVITAPSTRPALAPHRLEPRI